MNMQYKAAQRFWGKVEEENTVADGLQYFKCSCGDGYVIDQNRLPGGKHNFMSFAGSYIIHSSDWRELAKLSPQFAYAVYQTQTALKRLYRSFEDFRQAVLGK
ncbi:hypothetical protein SAMN02746089_02508 [Caldanaerobius fijiensis DSM 17918]|uniref:Uncharacterized protein n=1 Tax=Caldanaerobius fijiensis DSM 17918 TaxID=1121256 RepID=A0A1M5EAK3_9THEO|nr:hypothetical protein [Caldanaerobius fijiensis]SHF76200.1 hypothetical protein SAMN02746089_02508 [Caldanaerobius fijiensis DSM 17918]